MSKLWSDKIRKIDPYVPGEQPAIKNIIKLNTNENPYPPSPKVNALLENYNTDKLRLYPSFKCTELKSVLCDTYNITPDQIFLGNGSDEVLALCFLTFFNSEKPVLFPDITYSFYDVWCDLYNIKYNRPALDDNFKIVKEDYYTENSNFISGNGGIVITNPNAPTGVLMPLNEIEDIIKHNQDCIVIVDEAYIDFGGQSALPLVNKYDNLVVVHTFSKSRSLAGIRVGYAISNPDLINSLEAVKNSFNSYTLNSLSQLIATECARDVKYFDETRNKIIETRERTVKELTELGFKINPSSSNFIFPTHPTIKAEELFNYLKSKNIIVRYFNKPRINNHLRITIGTDYEMDTLIKEIKNFINQI